MALPISFAQDGQTSAVPLVFHLLSPRNESSSRVTTDTGILDGADPSKYDPKNPLNLFIIQVCVLYQISFFPSLSQQQSPQFFFCRRKV